MQLFAWLGGALFVGALADAAYAYFVRWSTTSPFSGTTSLVTDVVLFAMLGLNQSVFGRESVKSAMRLVVEDRWLRTVYVWVASVLLLTAVELWTLVGGEIYRTSGALAAALVVFQLGGLALIAKSVAAIDPLELAGIRAPAAGGLLTTSGPYRIGRHPLYLGWIVLVFGTPHMTGDRLVFAVVTTLYLITAIPWEEQSLLRAYGAAYASYQQTVRWRVVPYLY